MLTRKPTRFFTVSLALGAVVLAGLSMGLPPTQARTLTAGEPEPPPPARVIHLANDQLTVTVHEVSRLEILQEVARQGEFSLELSAAIRARLADERVSVAIYQLPLDEGLMRILPHHSFALGHAPHAPAHGHGSVRQSKTLWIVPREEEPAVGDGGRSGARGPLSQARPAAAKEDGFDLSKFEEALMSEDAGDREDAVKALGDSGEPEAVGLLTAALEDEDEDVRGDAIEALVHIGGAEAAKALDVALRDEEADIRAEAVEALEEIGGETATRLLKQALADPDEDVRESAADTLEDLKD